MNAMDGLLKDIEERYKSMNSPLRFPVCEQPAAVTVSMASDAVIRGFKKA